MMAGGYYRSLCAIIMWLCWGYYCSAGRVQPFDDNYITNWGAQQFTFLNERTQVQIQITENSGGGFRSKEAYVSGYFKVSLKIPKNATGIATTFYLTSLEDNAPGGGNHDELDFELLGRNGPPYILNTNIFAQDSGNREQQFNLWFDPTSDFHDYAILWNHKQIVFYVDKIPVRVFENNRAKYPNQPMYIHGSLWNSSQWLGQTDWSLGPFIANYASFEVWGCAATANSHCAHHSWNAPHNWKLSGEERQIYELTKSKYIIYDYCKSDVAKNFSECQIAN